MPHGKPDWGVDWTPRTVRGLEDLGEHAVRLRSPHLFDRRGDVLWLTEFTEGIGPMELVANGVAGSIGMVTEHSRQGPLAVRLTCGSTGAGDAYGRMTLATPVLSLVGSECTFGWDTFLDYFEVEIRYYDGTNMHTGRIRYDDIANALRYWAGGVNYPIIVPGMNLAAYARPIHTMKVVINLTSIPITFVRAILNNIQYTFPPNVAVVMAGSGIGPFIEFSYRNQGAAANRIVFLDSVIITHNEPPT